MCRDTRFKKNAKIKKKTGITFILICLSDAQGKNGLRIYFADEAEAKEHPGFSIH